MSKMYKIFFFILLVTGYGLCIPKTFADVQEPILSIPDGQVILNISATVRREVEQDLLVATLSYTARNSDPHFLQNEINTVMANALKTVRREKNIRVSTGSYQVYEYTEPRIKDRKWQGLQSLTLKSKDADTLLALVGKLQDMKLTMNGLSYILAPETAVEIKDSLMEEALKQLQQRANRAARALGKSKAELREVNVQSTGNGRPVPYHKRAMVMESVMAADVAIAPPVAASDSTTITLSVSARALLKP